MWSDWRVGTLSLLCKQRPELGFWYHKKNKTKGNFLPSSSLISSWNDLTLWWAPLIFLVPKRRRRSWMSVLFLCSAYCGSFTRYSMVSSCSRGEGPNSSWWKEKKLTLDSLKRKESLAWKYSSRIPRGGKESREHDGMKQRSAPRTANHPSSCGVANLLHGTCPCPQFAHYT